MKIFIYAIIILQFKLLSVFSSDADQKLHVECIYPTIKILDVEQKNGGTGFIARSVQFENKWVNFVVTAAHVVSEENQLFAHVSLYKNLSEVFSNEKYPLEIFAEDYKRDIALGVFLSENKCNSVEFDFTSKTFIGTDVFHVGHALFDDAKISYGKVTQPKTLQPIIFAGMIRTDCFAFLGDSGAALFLKSNYKVIGLCHGIRSHQGNMLGQISYFQPITELKKWNEEQNDFFAVLFDEKETIPELVISKIKYREKNTK